MAIQLRRTSQPANEGRWTSCDEEGFFRFERVATREVQLNARMINEGSPERSIRVLMRTVHVGEGDTLPVDLDLPAHPCSVQGSVSLNGQPPMMGRLSAEWTTEIGDSESVEVSCDPEGHYLGEGLPQTALLIRIEAFGRNSVSVR